MLSWRLWRTVADADINNPIFRRVSQIHRPTARSRPRVQAPRLFWLLAALTTIAAVIVAPQLIVLIFVVPIFMITLIVAAPLLLPLLIWWAGLFSTGEIISGIYREKHQYTYDLICSSTQGKLNASWSFATGILYRGNWFAPLRWGTRVSLRFGSAALAGLTILALLIAVSRSYPVGFEQLRLLLMLPLIMTLYYTNMTQTFVISHIIGLFVSSFEWAKRDAMLGGLVAYFLHSVMPVALAGLVYFAFSWLVFDPHPMMRIGLETSAILLIVVMREAGIILLWSALKRRMNSSRAEAERGEIPLHDAAWGVT